MKRKTYQEPECQVLALAQSGALCVSDYTSGFSTPGDYIVDDNYNEME